jgi:predicted acyl esterase
LAAPFAEKGGPSVKGQRFRLAACITWGLGTGNAAAAVPMGEYQVAAEAAVRVSMRDGVGLVADVYRPDAPGTFPVLLQRTPYNRAQPGTGILLASHGYVVVLQDTRGRYDSEGEFYPFRSEGRDGFDTVEWAATLPYSNGKVGMFGGSYVGATQMLAAAAHPPHLAAIFPYVTASEYYEGWTYQSGAFMQWFASSWASLLAEDTARRASRSSSRWRDWASSLPVESFRLLDLPVPGQIAPYYRDWVELWATSNLFKAGHRIRLYVSSSNFPRFNRNLNTGEPTLGGTRTVKARQVVFHDAERPSALVLPVIPAVGAGPR